HHRRRHRADPPHVERQAPPPVHVGAAEVRAHGRGPRAFLIASALLKPVATRHDGGDAVKGRRCRLLPERSSAWGPAWDPQLRTPWKSPGSEGSTPTRTPPRARS